MTWKPKQQAIRKGLVDGFYAVVNNDEDRGFSITLDRRGGDRTSLFMEERLELATMSSYQKHLPQPWFLFRCCESFELIL